ncbi:MAG: OmpH family outer membrane protein [Caulobacteraceae bacterium]
MTKSFAFAGASLLAGVALASAALAQAAAPAVTSGPPIPGMCIFSVNQAIASSKVGQYERQRMEQIVAQVKAEISPEETAINNEGRTLEASRATLNATTFQSRATALTTRVNALRQKADLRQREVKATEDKALNRISQELEPIASQLYQQKRCSALIDKNAVMIANPEMDITPQAVTALNAKIQQFTFDREHLDTAAGAR